MSDIEDVDRGERPGGSSGRVHGGRVRRTGIAVVHENEIIYPAESSEAEVNIAWDDDRTAIHYHFPVQIEIVGAVPPAEREDIVQESLGRLRRAVQGRAR